MVGKKGIPLKKGEEKEKMQSRKRLGESLSFEGLNVVVFGIGVSGKSAIRALIHSGSRVIVVNRGPVEEWVGVFENKDLDNIQCFSEDDSKIKKVMEEADLIVLSPGIPREHEILEGPLKKEIPVWSEIELGFHFCSLPVACVTGTNGKTTTVTLIGEMLKASGMKPFVGGNIGRAFCDLPFCDEQYDVVVLELSSFQLESIETFHPQISALLNVVPNHGERYKSFESYGLAKMNILKNIADGDTFLCFEGIPENFKNYLKELNVEVEYLPRVENKMEALFEDYDLEDFKLPGSHNLQNLLFAEKMSLALGATKEGVQKVITHFCGVDFRLQFIPSSHTFACYNDAKSTNWDATFSAIKALEGKEKSLSLILGGATRGRGDTLPPEFSSLKDQLHKIYLIGETTKALSKELIKLKMDHENCFSLSTVFERVKNEKNFQGHLLFSPAFPSFDQYTNYVERGMHFTELFGDV